MVEVVGKDVNLVTKWICPLRMVCQSADFVSTAEQKPGDVFARVAKRTGDDNRIA